MHHASCGSGVIHNVMIDGSFQGNQWPWTGPVVKGTLIDLRNEQTRSNIILGILAFV